MDDTELTGEIERAYDEMRAYAGTQGDAHRPSLALVLLLAAPGVSWLDACDAVCMAAMDARCDTGDVVRGLHALGIALPARGV